MTTQFDKPLVGYRFADTLVGDTLQAIALRELGDASRWPELISYNQLVPPFIVDDPALGGPGVLVTGAQILVPAPARAAVDTDPSLVYGSDVQLDRYGGITLDASGDFGAVAGQDNFKQALAIRLDTEPGDLMFHPTYGCDARRLIGAANGPTKGMLAARATRSSLAQDPRVDRVSSAVATTSADVISVVSEVESVAGHSVTTTSTA